MSTPTSFQVIQQTATELNGVLHNAQAEVWFVSVNVLCTLVADESHVQNYRNLIKALRDQVLLEASGTADCE